MTAGRGMSDLPVTDAELAEAYGFHLPSCSGPLVVAVQRVLH